MLRRVLTVAMALAVVLSTAACGSEDPSDGRLHMPASASNFEGEPYQDVVAEIESAGFTNVEAVALEDLVTGFLDKPDEVDTVSVDDDEIFSTDDRFLPDAAIVVSYHSFPVDEEADEQPSATPAPTDAAPAILTVENNTDFAAVLTLSDYCSPAIADFATKYDGQTIQFDAAIGAMNNHDGYATRYDILIGAGDYSETSGAGPAFQFRDVNITSDLGLTGSIIPDSLGVGDNLRVTASIDAYDANGGCLFILDPVSTEVR